MLMFFTVQSPENNAGSLKSTYAKGVMSHSHSMFVILGGGGDRGQFSKTKY